MKNLIFLFIILIAVTTFCNSYTCEDLENDIEGILNLYETLENTEDPFIYNLTDDDLYVSLKYFRNMLYLNISNDKLIKRFFEIYDNFDKNEKKIFKYIYHNVKYYYFLRKGLENE
jgi:hypothetical protein